MNTERVRILANYLRTQVEDEEFDMRVAMTACGTIGCIAGHAAKLFALDRTVAAPVVEDGPFGPCYQWNDCWLGTQGIRSIACDVLGLGGDEEEIAHAVFVGAWEQAMDLVRGNRVIWAILGETMPEWSRLDAATMLEALADAYDARHAGVAASPDREAEVQASVPHG